MSRTRDHAWDCATHVKLLTWQAEPPIEQEQQAARGWERDTGTSAAGQDPKTQANSRVGNIQGARPEGTRNSKEIKPSTLMANLRYIAPIFWMMALMDPYGAVGTALPPKTQRDSFRMMPLQESLDDPGERPLEGLGGISDRPAERDSHGGQNQNGKKETFGGEGRDRLEGVKTYLFHSPSPPWGTGMYNLPGYSSMGHLQVRCYSLGPPPLCLGMILR